MVLLTKQGIETHSSIVELFGTVNGHLRLGKLQGQTISRALMNLEVLVRLRLPNAKRFLSFSFSFFFFFAAVHLAIAFLSVAKETALSSTALEFCARVSSIL